MVTTENHPETQLEAIRYFSDPETCHAYMVGKRWLNGVRCPYCNGQFLNKFVDHAVEYVRDNVHTNGLENFWCLLKRTIKGTYVHVNAAQLEAYLDEQAWRSNERKLDDGERFSTVAQAVSGKRLTYKRLISRKLVR